MKIWADKMCEEMLIHPGIGDGTEHGDFEVTGEPSIVDLVEEVDFETLDKTMTEVYADIAGDTFQDLTDDREVIELEESTGPASFVYADWQEFTYEFENSKLMFCTYEDRQTKRDLDEILSLYGVLDVIQQIAGIDAIANNLSEAENVRRSLFTRKSLGNGYKSIRWKLYYSEDVLAAVDQTEFVGLVGMSVVEGNVLEPHIHLRPKFQGRGIGTKAISCIMQRILSHKDWFLQNINGLTISIHEDNEACLALKNNMMSPFLTERKNPDNRNGTWEMTYEWFTDNKDRTIYMKQFTCDNLESLESIWHILTNQKVKKSNQKLLEEAPCIYIKKRRIESNVRENEIMNKEHNKSMNLEDADWQVFSRSFYRNSENLRLYFETFKNDKLLTEEELLRELDEILYIYGNLEVMSQVTGIFHTANNVEEANNVRRALSAQFSLHGEKKSIVWKLYISRDDNPREFVGFVGMSLTESKHIAPHIRLHPEHHNKGIGTQFVYCILEKLLSRRAWLLENVKGVFMQIQPRNEACLMLRSKVASGLTDERKCLDSVDGVWSSVFEWISDGISRRERYRHFGCDGIGCLKKIWESEMIQKVKKADLQLCNRHLAGQQVQDVKNVHEKRKLEKGEAVAVNTQQSERRTESDIGESTAKVAKALSLDEAVEKSLQNFTFKYEHSGGLFEEFSFTTFEKVGPDSELDEVYSLFGEKEGVMKWLGSEIPLKDKEQAKMRREQMRNEISFFSERKTIRWKLYVKNDISKTDEPKTFVGYIGLHKNDRHLAPTICLFSKFRNTNYGTKAFTCILAKLLSNKRWFKRNFDGFCMKINPGNVQSTRLRDKLMGKYAEKVVNPDQHSGDWIIERKAFCDNRTKKVVREIYECNGFAKVESLFMARFTVVLRNKVWTLRDNKSSEVVTVSLLKTLPAFGLQQVKVGASDLWSLANDCRLQIETSGFSALLSVSGTFNVHFPQLVASPRLFYLFFFMGTNGPREFDVPLTIHDSRRQFYVALSSLECKNHALKVRLVDKTLKSVRAYVVELDVSVFESRNKQYKRVWITNRFDYTKTGYKSKHTTPCRDLDFTQLQMR